MPSEQIETGYAFGPWALDVPDDERRARLRAMRAIARLICGRRADVLCAALQIAEHDPGWLAFTVECLKRLDPLDRRKVLASYGALA